MKVNLYDQKNKKVGDLDLPDQIFGVKWNPDLVHQAIVAQLANRRKPFAHAKDRAEVRGGGKKPWRQKHTGRARVGSIRSPLWRGGGVTHGPLKERNFEQKINKKMKKLALFSALSKKLKDNEIIFVNDLKLENHKTKNMANLIRLFFKKPQSLLIVPEKGNRNAFIAARNIPKTDILNSESLNVYDCLTHKNFLIEKEVVSELNSKLQK